MKNFLTLFVIGLLVMGQAFAQVYTNKPVGAKNESLVDSYKGNGISVCVAHPWSKGCRTRV